MVEAKEWWYNKQGGDNMEYFVSHILYIVVAAFVIAAVCCAWAWMTAKNDKEREKNGEEIFQCGSGCAGCSSFSNCNKPEKK